MKQFIYSITLTSGLVEHAQFAPLDATDLPNSGVTPGSYTNASISVDATGRIVTASSGAAGMAIGSLVTSSHPDGSVLYTDASSDLAQAAAGQFIFDLTGSLGSLATAFTLYIGKSTAPRKTGYLALYDATNHAWGVLSIDGGHWIMSVGLQITGDVAAEAMFLVPVNDVVILDITAFSSQTADLISLFDSSSNLLSRVNHAGYFMTEKNSAPPDGDIFSGELAWWFDDTNGASKAMFKGKSANGTVVTGSVTLS